MACYRPQASSTPTHNLKIVDFPDPEGPTNATVDPGATRKETPLSVGRRGSYAKETRSAQFCQSQSNRISIMDRKHTKDNFALLDNQLLRIRNVLNLNRLLEQIQHLLHVHEIFLHKHARSQNMPPSDNRQTKSGNSTYLDLPIIVLDRCIESQVQVKHCLRPKIP